MNLKLLISVSAIIILSVIIVIGNVSALAYEIQSPLKQIQQGVKIDQIVCHLDKVLMDRNNGKVACVYDKSIKKLELLGWETIPQNIFSTQHNSDSLESQLMDEYMDNQNKTITEYYDNGMIKVEIEYFDNKHTPHNFGDLLSYNPRLDIIAKSKHHYDLQGNKEHTINYTQDQQIQSKIKYQYHENGDEKIKHYKNFLIYSQLLDKIELDHWESYIHYTYNENGTKSSITYDENNALKEEIQYYENFEIKSSKYYNNDTLWIEYSNYENGKEKTSKMYHENGNLMFENYFHENGDRKPTKHYHENGNMKWIIEYDVNGDEKYRIEYDVNGDEITNKSVIIQNTIKETIEPKIKLEIQYIIEPLPINPQYSQILCNQAKTPMQLVTNKIKCVSDDKIPRMEKSGWQVIVNEKPIFAVNSKCHPEDNSCVEPISNSNNTTKYSIDSSDDLCLLESTRRAVHDWQRLNPQLDFLQVKDKVESNVHIKIIPYDEYMLGYFDSDNNTIAITEPDLIIKEYDRVNKELVYSQQLDCKDYTNIIKHEIGHYLGLEHSENFNDLMYPFYINSNYDYGMPDVFDNLGYNIPTFENIKIEDLEFHDNGKLKSKTFHHENDMKRIIFYDVNGNLIER